MVASATENRTELRRARGFRMLSPMTTPVDQRAVAADWRKRNFSCGLWVDPPGRVWADFVHDTDEIVIVVEGDLEFEIAGVIHRPRVGEELFIPAGARHTVRNVGRDESRWLYGYRRGKASGT
jgi:mannose-6-phosphate isomerase-like protein (cupin superfamily)